jgi:glycosyltransferase involved in cell wall biosynthesis
MRISVVGPTYPFRGGIAQHTTLLCNTMRKKHEVQFISYTRQYPKIIFPGKTDRDPSKNALHTDSVEYLIDSMNPYSWYRASNAIVRFRPDRVVFPWWVIFWAPQTVYLAKKVKKKTNSKIIILCHNVTDHEGNRVKECINKYVLRNGDVLITQSNEETRKIKKILCSKYEDEKIITGFHPTYEDLCTNKKVNHCKDKKKYELLFFGFVRRYKGLNVLLEALPKILKSKNVQLKIVGEFWKDKLEYLQKIEELGIKKNITIIDEYIPNEQLGTYFHQADLVIQPYLSASGSGVSQLAYGFGKPVIASSVGSIGEIIEDGINGRLVNPGDPQGLSSAVLESLDPVKLTVMHNEAKKVAKRFSWDRFAEIITTC